MTPAELNHSNAYDEIVWLGDHSLNLLIISYGGFYFVKINLTHETHIY